MLAEGDTFGIDRTFGGPEKRFSDNGDNSNLFVNGKEIYKFKANNKNVNFPI